MNKYSKAKIYTIRCKSDTTLIYIGSTINSLSTRWGQHKSSCNNINHKHYNYYKYQIIRKNGGIDNFYIELYEDFPCNNKKELDRREGEVIRLIGTLNCHIAGRSQKDYAEEHKEKMDEYKKEWYIENRDEISEKKKMFYEEHKEEIKEKSKEYYQENKEKISERIKIYYIENKEEISEQRKIYYNEISEKRKIKYTCACGSTLTVSHKLRHERSIKHTNFIN